MVTNHVEELKKYVNVKKLQFTEQWDSHDAVFKFDYRIYFISSKNGTILLLWFKF